MRVLFLCTGNSSRSILAEAILGRLAKSDIVPLSAGSAPVGRVNQHALDVLGARGYETEGLRSKSWDEFTREGTAPVELVITVCSNVAGEVCPVFPGNPATIHWDIADPASNEPYEVQMAAFEATYDYLEKKISALVQSLENA